MTPEALNNPQQPAAQVEGCPYSAASPLLLRLYIADNSPISLQAIANLNELLRTLPAACYQLEIIDALLDPLLAVRDGILVTPTLLKSAPTPAMSLLGDLHDKQQLFRLLGIPGETI